MNATTRDLERSPHKKNSYETQKNQYMKYAKKCKKKLISTASLGRKIKSGKKSKILIFQNFKNLQKIS